MSDATNDPHFPAPRAREKDHAGEEASPISTTEHSEEAPSLVTAPEKLVVSRPDAPEVEPAVAKEGAREDAKAGAKVQLSKEEIRAFLAVENVHHTTKWKKAAKRGVILTIPTGLISFAVQTIFGWWGAGACVAFAIYWAARPLLKQDRDGWS